MPSSCLRFGWPRKRSAICLAVEEEHVAAIYPVDDRFEPIVVSAHAYPSSAVVEVAVFPVLDCTPARRHVGMAGDA